MTAICIAASLSFLALRKPYAHKSNSIVPGMSSLERNQKEANNLNATETIQRLTADLTTSSEDIISSAP